jgi:hypothetical protein
LSEGRKTETEPQSTKKKTMKSITEKKTKSGLKNRPEPLSTASQMQFDFNPRMATVEQQPTALTLILAELRFHWIKSRQTWEHYYGLIREQAFRVDPRSMYGCFLARTLKRR